MYHVKTLIVILVAFLLITHPDSYGIVYGSNTATTVQAFVTFPQADTTNTMLGFGSFANGFSLASASTTCTFNDFYPVTNSMVLNGGTLYLKEDLHLDSQLVVSSLGTIVGNKHRISFAAQAQTILFPNPGTLNQLSIQSPGSLVWSVAWSPDNQYLAVGTSAQSGSGKEATIYSLSATGTLSFAAGAHLGLLVNEVEWRPGTSPYYLAAATSGGIYAYHFTPPNSLVTTSTVATSTNFQAIAWHPSGNALAAGIGAITTPQLLMYDFNALTGTLTYATSYTFPGGINFQGKSLDFDYSGSYLAAGFDVPNQLQVLSWDGTTLVSTASAAAMTVGALLAVKWSPDGSLIAVGAGYNLQIFSFDRNAQSLAAWPYSFATPYRIYQVSWTPDGNTLAAGIAGTTNSLLLFAVNRLAKSLLCIGQYGIANSYSTSVRWSSNGTYLAVGSYNAGAAAVYNFLPGAMTFSNANIVFNSPVQMRAPTSFSGSCIIDCHGYPFDLNSQLLTVTAGSSLLFKDTTLEGITGTNLQCFDSAGTISFDNVTCMINNLMQLNQGKFAIIGECIMTGTGTFVYSSNQASTISSHAQWYFDHGVTFSYYPQGGGTSLINFADSSAQLYLYATNLCAASTGLHLTKGCLMIDGPCQFLSDSATETTGIWIGDGTAADDLKVKILAESGIIVGKGYVSYRNTK